MDIFKNLDKKQDKEEIKKAQKGCFRYVVYFFAIIIALIILFSGNGDGVSVDESTPSDLEVFIISQGYVENILRSPSTADFPSSDYSVYNIGEDQYQVASYVDSQNGFGATIRSYYVINLTHNGGAWHSSASWSLDEFMFDGEIIYPIQ